MKIRFTQVERNGIRTKYAANIEVDGELAGYVQRNHGEDYWAYMEGRVVGRGRTLADIRQDIKEFVQSTYL